MIPVNSPFLNGNEKKYLIECIDTGWISSEGAFVRRFEDEFSSYVDRAHGIAVSNGSAALDIAIRALELEKGTEVIVPAFTIISPVQSILNSGLKPVLVDSDLDTWNMNIDAVERHISPNTSAILVVHIYGLPVDMSPILALAKKHNLKIIEDAAEMIGQDYKARKCGSFGDISTFSFYPNKHVTTGEGGMVVTDDDKLAERCKMLRNLCFTPKKRYVHEEIGWNYRMTNMQAALGVAQLEQIESNVKRKREIGYRYSNNLKDLKCLQLPLKRTDYAENIFWVYGIMADDEALAVRIQKGLNDRKIGTRTFFWPMHQQPVFKNMGLFQNNIFPNAEKMARQGFYIPSGLAITNEEIDIVSSHIITIVNG